MFWIPFKKRLVMGLVAMSAVTSVQAGIPVWSFTPDPNFPPSTQVSSTSTVTVKYTVTNNSYKPHTLTIKPVLGLTQDAPCMLTPTGSAGSSCILSLTITGSNLVQKGLYGGPVLCQTNADKTPNLNQCYQPSQGDTLAVKMVSE